MENKEFNFLEEVEDEMDKQFPKGKCKERGNALVLNAMINILFDKYVKLLKENLSIIGWSNRINNKTCEEIIDDISKVKLRGIN